MGQVGQVGHGISTVLDMHTIKIVILWQHKLIDQMHKNLNHDIIHFKRLCLLNIWMEIHIVHTCPDVRYWSEILCCTILTHMSELGQGQT